MKTYTRQQLVRYCAVSILVVIIVGIGGGWVAVANTPYYSRLKYALKDHLIESKEVKDARDRYQNVISRRNQELSPEEQTEIMTLFHRLRIWQSMYWMGVQIEKNPCDMWMMQQVIWEIQPDFIVEAGTFHGGSAFYYAHMLEGMGLDNSRVITVDIKDYTSKVSQRRLWKEKVDFILGSSTDPEIVESIKQRVAGKKVIVVLDSDHSRDHVFNELNAYASIVQPGSYIVVEDTNMDGIPLFPERGPGPMAAVEDFLKTPKGADFEVDVAREAMILTFNPSGWLRKKG